MHRFAVNRGMVLPFDNGLHLINYAVEFALVKRSNANSTDLEGYSHIRPYSLGACHINDFGLHNIFLSPNGYGLNPGVAPGSRLAWAILAPRHWYALITTALSIDKIAWLGMVGMQRAFQGPWTGDGSAGP